jgi:hypothetical protein
MWLGTLNVPLDSTGSGSYDHMLPRTVPRGWLVASTAADPVFGTTEFSASQTVQPALDSDGDGLPDHWEARYPSCLNPTVPDPADEDCDGDGFTNLQEYTAGTDPTMADSALQVQRLEITGTGAQLKFTGIAGRQYGLERKITVTDPWVRVVTAIPAVDGEVTLTDPEAYLFPNAFYRYLAEFP